MANRDDLTKSMWAFGAQPNGKDLSPTMWASGNHTSTRSIFNPSVPQFTPAEGLQSHVNFSQYPTVAAPGMFDIAQIHRMLADITLSNSNHFLELERRNHKLQTEIKELRTVTKAEVEELRAATQHDLEYLEGSIEARKHGHDFAVGVSDRPDSPSSSLSCIEDNKKSKELLQNESREEVLSLHSVKAEGIEDEGQKVRTYRTINYVADKLAHELSAQKNGPADGSETSVGASPSVVAPFAKFACCENIFPTLSGLLDHVNQTHRAFVASEPESTARIDNSLTSAGAPHSVPRRSHAVEIKAPKVESEKTPVRAPFHAYGNEDQSMADASEITSPWRPVAVRQMPPANVTVPATHTETFTWELLKGRLDGCEWSPSFYFGAPMLPSNSYWILEADFEPFLPCGPGQHGAKITAFFNMTPSAPDQAPTEVNYLDVPVFIRRKGEGEYQYYGQYSQKRFSDKVGYDTLFDHIPEHVHQYWAEQLADQGRPLWVTDELRKHFWPKPEYDGPIPTNTATDTPATGTTDSRTSDGTIETRVLRALKSYARDLEGWNTEAAFKMSHVTHGSLLQAFRGADAGEEPGLRLWWEYLECTGYDAGFYELLVEMKHHESTKRIVGSEGRKRPPTPPPHSDMSAAPPPPPHMKTMDTKPKQKNHTITVKPWEKDGKGGETKGDLAAAREVQDGATRSQPKAGHGGW